jgi:uncharacterized protein
MAEVGKYNKLKVLKELDFGMYLDGAGLGEILLPRRYIPEGSKIDDELEVFLYFDSEDRIIATTEKPYATVGEVALLRVKSVDQIGAFLDWGLMKDLLVPFREQKITMNENRSYVVYVYYDKVSNRIAASAKLEQFLDNTPPAYGTGEMVDLIIWQKTELGYKAAINHSHLGVLYANEVFQHLDVGQSIKGYVKKIREDHKIDLNLYPAGYKRIEQLSDKIIGYLEERDGFAPITDDTAPEIIYSLFGASKKTFKRTLGRLYKERVLLLDKEGIHLIKSN